MTIGKRISSIGITAAFVCVTLACAGGGRTPEEALATFNAEMEVRDFERAAAVTYFEWWDHTPGVSSDRKRAESVASLEQFYTRNGLSYGSAEIVGRKEITDGVVELSVSYRKRDEAEAPPAKCAMTFKRVSGRWYYFIPVPPAGPGAAVPPAPGDGTTAPAWFGRVGATPEGAVEAYNRCMALGEYEGAAAFIYCDDVRRAEVPGVLRVVANQEGFDYGCAEIIGRANVDGDAATVTVRYTGAGGGCAPARTREVGLTRAGGEWYILFVWAGGAPGKK